MTTRQYSSRSQQSTLTGTITSGATSMTVVSGTTLLGGVTIPAGRTFTLVIDPDTALEEIVDATVVATNTFTVTRAIDGSTAQEHSAGAVVRHMAIGRDFRDANLHAEADASYNDGSGNAHTMHGIAAGEGTVVGTDKTQTLTNKTLTSPIISNPTFTGTPSAEASIVFEGSTADAHETTLTVVDPTQDNTITLPNTTGTVVIATATQTLTNKTLTSPVISGTPVITGLSSAGMVSSSATPKDYVDSILGSATAAATSAASAATSAASAATSASSAATSASNALTSANSASTSATAAATSAASAATSATAAATSASSASTSASSALTSANSASTSATAAATSATSAAASALTAANSVATIAGYATTASNSASAAATSATSAAASATAAATSATSAAASATAAATSATSAAASATTAANSASAAATSATSAAASATAASTSETNAAASATAAATSASSASTSASSALTSANSASTSAASAATSASSAAASFDSFDDRYLGPKASAPTVDNDGNPLTSGVLYYNTTSGVMFVYNGNTSAWEQVAVSTSGFPTLAGNNDFTGLNTFTNAGTADVLRVTNNGTGNSLVVEDSTNPDSSPTVIDASGNIITGYTSALSASGYSGLSTAPRLQVQGTSGAGSAVGLSNWANNAASAGAFIINKSKSGTIGTYGATTTGDDVGALVFNADDGTEFLRSSMVFAEVDGAVSTGIVPGRLGFYTTSTAGTLTERMRIDSAGGVGIGATPTTGVNLRIGKNITGNAIAFGTYSNPIIQSDVTTSAQIHSTLPSIVNETFTLGSLSHYLAAQGTKGVSATITNQYGFRVEGSLTAATNNYGFFGNLASASNVWNFYALGTAANFFAGRVGIGTTLTSGAMALVANTTAADVGLVIRGAASQSGSLLRVENSASSALLTVDSGGTLYVGTTSVLSPTLGNIGVGLSTATAGLEIGTSRTGDGTSYIDFGSDTTYTDHSLRIIRNAGANGASGISHRGTGLFYISATEAAAITFSTTNAERMRIDASGNVGIGTTSPTSLSGYGVLTLNGTNGSILSNMLNGTENFRIQTYSGFTVFNEVVSGGLAFNTNNTERMRIDSSGNTTINAIADATTTTAARGGGYMGIPQSAASGSGAYTIVAADAGEHIYTTTTRTVTIPANSSVAFPVGTVLTFISGVGATTTIAITTDTMYLAGAGTTGSRTLAAHGMATAVKVASTTWYISGNGLT